MSDTPRTESMQGHRLVAHVPVLFARTLERELNAANAEIDFLRADLARLTAERDEARRELCRVLSGFDTTRALRIAEHRGWDCYAPHANTTDVPVQNGGE